MLSKFLRYDKDNIIFTGEKLEMYIPTDWFDNGMAEMVGNRVSVLGLLHIRCYDIKGKMIFQNIMNLPSTIIIRPKTIENRTEDIGYDMGLNKYTICVFYKNDIVMSRYIQKDSDNVQDFLNMIMRAKISGIPYSTLLDVWKRNLEINAVDLGVPNSIMELILSEIYRSADDLVDNYATVKNKNPNLSETSYIPANERQLCAKNSTFAALSFEDIDSMITYSLNMTKSNQEQKISPIEKVIRY